MTNRPNYWAEYWKEYGEQAHGEEEQVQVLRTFNKKPISEELWSFTLQGITEHVNPQADDIVLELCCGNGLISRHLSPNVKKIISVDVSPDLVKTIDNTLYPNIEAVVSDIRELAFDNDSFDKVIIYAGIQYLTLSETTDLFEKVFYWLKSSGTFFLGDIPDYDKRWVFYNTPEREAVFFQNLRDGKDVVGTWFDASFFKRLGRFVGFSDAYLIEQHEDLIYSSFRYDYKLVK